MQHHFTDVFANLPGSKSAQQEGLDFLLHHLLHHSPQYFDRHTSYITNQLTQQTWNITPDEIASGNIGQHFWIRVKRQTLQRLPPRHSILFTIRTYRYPLSTLEQHPSMAHSLLTAIQQMSAAMQQYKSILPIQPALCSYLAQLSNPVTSPSGSNR